MSCTLAHTNVGQLYHSASKIVAIRILQIFFYYIMKICP